MIQNEKSLRDLELDREGLMIAQGKERYEQQLKKNVEKGRNSVTPPYIYLQKKYLVPLSEAIQNFIDENLNGKAGVRATSVIPLRDLDDPKKISLITLKGIIDGIALNKTLLQIAVAIGRMIELEEQSLIFKKDKPFLHNKILRDLMTRTTNIQHRQKVFSHSLDKFKIQIEKWNISKVALVGQQLIGLVITHTDLVERKIIKIRKNNTQNYLTLTPAIQEKIDDGNFRCSVLTPYHKPMIVKPNDWTSAFSGGYINEYLSKAPLVKTEDYQYLASLKDRDLSDFYGAINYLQGVEFATDNNMLPIFNEIWDRGLTIGNFPSRDRLLDDKNKPIGIYRDPRIDDDSEQGRNLLRKYKRDLSRVYADEIARVSKVVNTSTAKDIANEYKDFKKFHFVTNVDTRGRVYSVGTTYNYQSDQKIKSIICFANGEKLGERGAYWLYIHTANTFGNDKVTYDERVDFIKGMEREIVAYAEDSFANTGWKDADKPMEFLQACHHIRGYLAQGNDYVCNLPVGVDATCSGLQILSILMKDKDTAAKVNVTPSETPQDVYTIVALKVEKEVKQEAGAGSPEANRWLQYGISRSIVKRNIMTYVYGLKPYGARQQIFDEYKKQVDLGHKPKCLEDDGFADCKWLANIVWKHLENEIRLASNLMKWFQETAKVFSRANLSMKWTTPIGFPVVQDYRYLNKFKVKTSIAGSMVYTTLRRQMDRKDTRKMSSSASPNIVHSIDGAIACATALYCKMDARPIPNLMMIHDSFATTPNRVDDLQRLIRKVVVDLFSGDYLEELYKQFLDLLPKELHSKITPPPVRGDLDISSVEHSRYFFN